MIPSDARFLSADHDDDDDDDNGKVVLLLSLCLRLLI